MLDDSSRVINTSDGDTDGDSDDSSNKNSGKVIHRALKTKEDIQNYVKHLI